MAELQSLARPYAKAVFELARETNALPAWSQTLATLALTASDAQVVAEIGNPRFSRGDAAKLIIGALGERLNAQAQNLVRLLAENHRIALLPALATEFEALKAEAEKRVEVDITTASEIDSAQKQSLASAIGKRLSREVEVTWNTDASLIAGAVIRAGDLVIDGSVADELTQLRHSLVS
ncbi:MAG: synthase subunit delta [Nevskia sp.]|nr:synthase subunit delta [Nevskia sp.]